MPSTPPSASPRPPDPQPRASGPAGGGPTAHAPEVVGPPPADPAPTHPKEPRANEAQPRPTTPKTFTRDHTKPLTSEDYEAYVVLTETTTRHRYALRLRHPIRAAATSPTDPRYQTAA
jgi:hypothetical protein